MQPPPCGCVLKLLPLPIGEVWLKAAASVRLCVETFVYVVNDEPNSAAASVRLCVETIAH